MVPWFVHVDFRMFPDFFWVSESNMFVEMSRVSASIDSQASTHVNSMGWTNRHEDLRSWKVLSKETLSFTRRTWGCRHSSWSDPTNTKWGKTQLHALQSGEHRYGGFLKLSVPQNNQKMSIIKRNTNGLGGTHILGNTHIIYLKSFGHMFFPSKALMIRLLFGPPLAPLLG